MNIKKAAFCYALSIIMVLFTSCQVMSSTKSIDFFAMDTVISLKISGKQADTALTQTKKEIKRLEGIFSNTIEHSDISMINQNFQADFETIHPETKEILQLSNHLSEETNGCFDITLGNFVKLWGFTEETKRVPSPIELQQAQQHVGNAHLKLADGILLEQQIQLDLGAIAKGYITDQVVNLLQQYDIDSAILSIGGNVSVIGNQQQPFQVGIANPMQPNTLIGSISVSNCAIVTSGDYQRYFEQDGIRYHHILDPKTGYPANQGLSSVTVICESAALADAYATALFVMGLDTGIQFVENHPEIEAIFVTKEGQVKCSTGIDSQFTPHSNVQVIS